MFAKQTCGLPSNRPSPALLQVPLIKFAPRKRGRLLPTKRDLVSSLRRKAKGYFGFATLLGQRGSDKHTVLSFTTALLQVPLLNSHHEKEVGFCLPLSWCEKRDLNPYSVNYTPLKRARLPVPPLSHKILSCYQRGLLFVARATSVLYYKSKEMSIPFLKFF